MENRRGTLYQRERKKVMILTVICVMLLALTVVLGINVISLNNKVNKLMQESSTEEELTENTEDTSAD
ncbi:MAG: hypothetical protein IJA58_08870, partial [Lachnospiraceae bacterium]|nr:hypothetical protein [Lachnospiraceae bacterium]